MAFKLAGRLRSLINFSSDCRNYSFAQHTDLKAPPAPFRKERMKQDYTDLQDAPNGASSWQTQAESLTQASDNPHHAAARGFGQAFGLHPIPAITTLAVNAMLFGGTIISMGALAPLAILVAIVLGVITYKAQMRFYGDDAEAARIKALAVGLITAIPVGLPMFLTVPSAVVGALHTLRRSA
jgi:hypothetical protein